MDDTNLRTTEISATAQIVAAFLSRQGLAQTEIPKLIADTYTAVSRLGVAPPEDVMTAAPEPAVSIKKSITPDFIICLDDGLKFRSLKRHIAKLGMTPDEYRAKWGLPRDYPMVAPNYSAVRSGLAKANGLGKNRGA